MKYKKTETKKAQILLMTLIVLMILAIIVVATIRLTSKDSSQITANLKYEDFYNSSETKSQNIIQTIAELSSSDLDFDNAGQPKNATLKSQCQQFLKQNNEIKYECLYTDPANTGNTDVSTAVEINQTKFIEDYVLNKDESFAIQLDGYKKGITLSWLEDQASLELRLVYFINSNPGPAVTWDSNEFLDVIGGIYDSTTTGVIKSDASSTNAVAQSFTLSAQTPTSFHLDIGTSPEISTDTNSYPLYLMVTPRIRQTSTYKSIKLSLQADDYSIFPYQVREVVSKTFDKSDASTPLVELRSVIPIRPQTDSIFNYSLITPSQVVLPLN